MTTALKDLFGVDVPETIASMIGEVDGSFDRDAFVADALDGFLDLELTPRARHIADALATHLPEDRSEAMQTIIDSLGPELESEELEGMAGFLYLPFVFFVAEYGIDDFDTAMRAQYELTKRFTAEFSIRAFFERYPERTLEMARTWARDPDLHVRRLVSEGSRPRLPWAPRLRSFQADPTPVLELLEMLRHDPSEYVRRSVANNLNDIAKDHPDRVIDTARRWWNGANSDEQRMIRHGLRTLIKQGNIDALDILGYGPSSPVTVTNVRVDPPIAEIGESIRVTVDLANPTPTSAGALVDLRVHFVKANGSTSPKVFKGAELEIEGGATRSVSKKISVRQHSTRTHHPGTHHVDVLLNGVIVDGPDFELT